MQVYKSTPTPTPKLKKKFRGYKIRKSSAKPIVEEKPKKKRGNPNFKKKSTLH